MFRFLQPARDDSVESKLELSDRVTKVAGSHSLRFSVDLERDCVDMDIIRFKVDALNVEVHPNSKSCGHAAAENASQAISKLCKIQDVVGVVFATGASQMDTLDSLVNRQEVCWDKIVGFHLDEYVDLDQDHPASFRKYLRQNLTSRVPIRKFFEIDGNAPDPDSFCLAYAEQLREADPQLCLLGIGENGHLAFNDPGVANFQDPCEMKAALLDSACRKQQAAEGWFQTWEDVPDRALTLTIPTIMHIPKLILSVPGQRKAEIVRRTFHEAISEQCPATILRTHPDATLFLDSESAAQLNLEDGVLSTDATRKV
jgi:glucosamine-6-phosphate deaminase